MRRMVMRRLGCGGAVLLALAGALQAADEAPPPERGWKSELVGGLGLTSGNSKTFLANAGASTGIKSRSDEFKASAEYKFGESTVTDGDGNEIDDTTAKTGQGSSQYNHIIDDGTYFLLQLNALYDAIALIDYRVIGGPGIGQYFIKTKKTTLAGEFGLSYLTERVDEVQDDHTLYRVAQRLERLYSEGSRVWQSVEYLPQVSNTDDYLLNAELGAEALISGSISLRVVMQDRYDSEPAEDREKNDLAVTAGVVYKL